MSASDLLKLLAPVVSDMDGQTKSDALNLAAEYRPACLPEAKQDEAQALYAAWLLYGIKQQEAAPYVAPVGAVSIKEDRLSVTFASGADKTGVDDPMGFYARWKALNNLCRAGGIIAGNHYDHGHR